MTVDYPYAFRPAGLDRAAKLRAGDEAHRDLRARTLIFWNGKLLVEKSHPHKAELAALGHDVVEMPDGDMRAGAVTAAGIVDGAPIACADWRRTTWAGIV